MDIKINSVAEMDVAWRIARRFALFADNTYSEKVEGRLYTPHVGICVDAQLFSGDVLIRVTYRVPEVEAGGPTAGVFCSKNVYQLASCFGDYERAIGCGRTPISKGALALLSVAVAVLTADLNRSSELRRERYCRWEELELEQGKFAASLQDYQRIIKGA